MGIEQKKWFNTVVGGAGTLAKRKNAYGKESQRDANQDLGNHNHSQYAATGKTATDSESANERPAWVSLEMVDE